MNIPQPYSSPFTEAFDKAVQVYLPDGGVIGTVTDPNAVPIDFIPHMAQYIGGIAITTIFGETVARRLYGSNDEGKNYNNELHRSTGKSESLYWIGSPFGVSINAQAGVFTKDNADPTDKSKWVLTAQTNPSTVRPTGLNVTIVAHTVDPDIFDTAHIGYFTAVIEEVIPFWFKDVRVQVVSGAVATMYTASVIIPNVEVAYDYT